MENFTMEEYWRLWDKKREELDNSDPWLVYVAEKSKTSCMKCQENHAKRYRSSDPSKPTLPIHPNCKCRYELLSKVSPDKITMRSVKMFVKTDPKYVKLTYSEIFDRIKNNKMKINEVSYYNLKSEFDPYDYGFPQSDFSISSTDNMLDILERECKPGTLGELIIVNHGEKSGKLELGDAANSLENMTERQMERLYNLLSPNAVIDIRMCYGIADKNREEFVQKLANRLRCRIRAYAKKVTTLGFRPITYDKSWLDIIYYESGGKTFYPK